MSSQSQPTGESLTSDTDEPTPDETQPSQSDAIEPAPNEANHETDAPEQGDQDGCVSALAVAECETTARVTVRMPVSDLEAVDELVDAGEFESRSAAIRAGIVQLTARSDTS